MKIKLKRKAKRKLKVSIEKEILGEKRHKKSLLEMAK